MRVDVWLSQYYNAMTTTVVLRHQRVHPLLFAGQIGHTTGIISSSVTPCMHFSHLILKLSRVATNNLLAIIYK